MRYLGVARVHARASGVAEILLSLRCIQAPLIDRSLAFARANLQSVPILRHDVCQHTSGCTGEDRGINRESVAISQR